MKIKFLLSQEKIEHRKTRRQMLRWEEYLDLNEGIVPIKQGQYLRWIMEKEYFSAEVGNIFRWKGE